jgi:putative membrane-bound dehydrogenase-like protein
VWQPMLGNRSPRAVRTLARLLVTAVTLSSAAVFASDGNRLAYLDDPVNPYYVGRDFAKLTTPMWIGEPGVEAVVVLAIDDMRGHAKWEQYLRPILDRLKAIDGRAPVSIMTCTIEREEPHLQKWLQEGLSLEVHTIDHPCPLLKDGDFAKAKSTYDRCVELLASVPNNKPVAFRMPCCDSLNTLSPRFFSEIFDKTTPAGNFLQLDSSVFNIFTPDDPSLPRELVVDTDGQPKFSKYVPPGRSFVNTIENYPYPYVIGGKCWEFPCVTPSDWQAQNLHKPFNPITVADMKAALDATVVKQGVFNLVFHPHGWIKPEQVVELIDHAVAKHGSKVKFLTFRDALERLNKNVLAGRPLRGADGKETGARLADLNNDGWMDVLSPASHPSNGAGHETVRIWRPERQNWRDVAVPTGFSQARFGVLEKSGAATAFVHQTNLTQYGFDGEAWTSYATSIASTGNSGGTPADRLVNYWLRDVDGDGISELLAEYDRADAQGQLRHMLFSWDTSRKGWVPRSSARFPSSTASIGYGMTNSMRLFDVNDDGLKDLVISSADSYSVHLFESIDRGWGQTVVNLKRDQDALHKAPPPFVRPDGTENGVWMHSGHIWWQNEDTARLPDLVDRRSLQDLLGDGLPSAKSPEESLRSIRTRPGFRVELVAAEPLVMDPIAFAWGPDGKLWVVEMGDYPLGVDGHGKHGGIVRFLEDTDGDGKYDKSTVFLEGLGFPTGVMPWRKGVLVTCAPDILYAEDTDGDGKADVKRAVFSGFGEGNPQHRLNGLSWGMDGWVYGANGDSGGGIRAPSHTEYEPVSISGRDFRIRPDDGRIEAATGQSQFGRSRDDWGNWFGCNNSNPMYQFVLPDHYMRRNAFIPTPDPRVNVSVVPGASPVFPTSRTLERFNDPNTANRFTSACSVTVYRDDLFGREFDGNSFVSEPVHNLIHREIMTPNGITFSSRRAEDEQTSEFLSSSDNWFRPTTIKTGPDGALWVADMYRLVIEHPEWIPKEWQERLDLRAGHDLGRIYRVFPADKSPRAIPRMDRLDTAGLVAALDSASGWQRDMAQMMLMWNQDKAAAPGLERLAMSAGPPAVRVQALWALQGLGALSDSVLLRALGDTHPGIRRNAVQLAESRLNRAPAVAETVLRRAADAAASVRFQVALSLGEWDDRRAGAGLSAIARRDANDGWVMAAVASSAAKHAGSIATGLLAPREPSGAPDPGATLALIERLIGQIIAQEDLDALGGVLRAITITRSAGAAPARWQIELVAGVFDALDRRNQSLATLEAKAKGDTRASFEAIRKMSAAARAIAADGAALPADRASAIRLLGRDPDRASDDRETLLRLLAPQTPSDVQDAAVAVAMRSSDASTAQRLLGGWAGHGPRIRATLLDAMLARESWSQALLEQIEKGVVPAAEIDARHRQRLLDNQSASVRDRAAEIFGRPSDESRQRIIDAYRAAAQAPGNAQQGAAVFQKVCAGCHKLGSVGHEIGPDLSAMANRSAEFFLTAILDPNRAVETRYLSYLAATHDGRIVSGMLAAESGNSVTLVAQEGKRETLLRSDIESLQSSGKSLMPDGVERDVTPQAMADLLTFLHSAGPPRKSFAGNRPERVKPELLRHEVYLEASTCEIYGDTLVFEDKYKNLGYWSSENDHALWNFEIDRPGKYSVTMDYACEDAVAGNHFVIELDDNQITGRVAGTGNWDTYKQQRVGMVTLPVGPHRLVFRPAAAVTGSLIDLRGVRLTPAK